MDWHDDRWKPSRQQYKEFTNDLAERRDQKAITSGAKILIAMLLLIPLTALFIALVMGLYRGWMQRAFIAAALLGLTAWSIIQAYKGLVRHRVRVLPRGRPRNESGYVGGRMKEVVTGKSASVAGIIFLVAGVAFLVAAIASFYF